MKENIISEIKAFAKYKSTISKSKTKVTARNYTRNKEIINHLKHDKIKISLLKCHHKMKLKTKNPFNLKLHSSSVCIF